MTKLEKVIYSLERCTCHVPDACRDCAYDDKDAPDCWNALERDALELLKEQQWISVKDRLPKHGQTVLAWEVSGFVYVDNYDGEHDIFKIAYNNGGTVTHWQSLPKPPKEDKDDDE